MPRPESCIPSCHRQVANPAFNMRSCNATARCRFAFLLLFLKKESIVGILANLVVTTCLPLSLVALSLRCVVCRACTRSRHVHIYLAVTLTAAVAPDAGSQQYSNLDSARANMRRLWYICLAPEVVRFLHADCGADRDLGPKRVQLAQHTELQHGAVLRQAARRHEAWPAALPP